MSAPQKLIMAKASDQWSLGCGIFFGMLAALSLYLMVTGMGGDWIAGIVLALVGGAVVGALVCRDRRLVDRAEQAEAKWITEVGFKDARLEYLYMNSVASLVEFDVDTGVISRASLGFIGLLGLDSDVDVRGRSLGELLRVEPASFESLVEQIKRGGMKAHEVLSCRDSKGRSIHLRLSGNYLPEENLIEVAFFRQVDSEGWSRELEQTQDDLERFRKGIVRREQRVLELKGEVNFLLSEAGKPARYQVDDKSDDSDFIAKATQENGARFTHG